MRPPSARSPLPTLLSQALVAWTIELDNEAEHRLQHRTTRGEDESADRTGPWLVSFPLWANVLQYVDPEGTTVAELTERARTSRLLLGGLQRWGYVRLEPPAGATLKKPPQPETLVRPTRHADAACKVWTTLPELIDTRWRVRFGDPAVDALRAALETIYDALDIDPPAYLPSVYPTQGGKAEAPVLRAASPRNNREGTGCALAALLAGVLFAFTLDFETVSRIALPTSANTLRVLDGEGVRLRDLPTLTGVSKEANAMCSGWLQRHGCAELARDPAARGQVLRLTAKGRGAQAKYLRVLAETEEDWRARYGPTAIDALRAALEPLVGDGALPASPLAPGLEPGPGNWRARVRPPSMLPHYPMVLHRGAYPDGS